MRLMISPSLLSADMARLGEEVRRAEAAGADLIHVDVMDGHFVPNITFGPVVVKAIKKYATRPLDVHLMISDPAKYMDAFLEAGSDIVTFHVEATDDVAGLCEEIRRAGARPSLSMRPQTPIESVYPHLDDIEMVLVMTVNPGFGGQEMIPECVEKVRLLRKEAGNRFDIEVDGGVNLETVSRVAEAGANIFVAGNALFTHEKLSFAISEMRRRAIEASPLSLHQT